MEKPDIPIWEKYALTLEEAAAYFNIGQNKISSMATSDSCPFVLFVGRKKLIKRQAFEHYLNHEYSL